MRCHVTSYGMRSSWRGRRPMRSAVWVRRSTGPGSSLRTCTSAGRQSRQESLLPIRTGSFAAWPGRSSRSLRSLRSRWNESWQRSRAAVEARHLLVDAATHHLTTADNPRPEPPAGVRLLATVHRPGSATRPAPLASARPGRRFRRRRRARLPIWGGPSRGFRLGLGQPFNGSSRSMAALKG